MHQPIYSVIVPVYGSSASLTVLAEKVADVFTKDIQEYYELIFVNDCSPNPNTATALKKCAEDNPNVKVITLTRNYGQPAATLCGIKECTGDYIITMDDDLQHDPMDITKLAEKKRHDVVLAKFLDKKHSLKKRLFSKFKAYFDHILLGKPKHIQLTSFRLIRRKIVNAMLEFRTPYPFIPAQIFQITEDIVNVPVTHHERYDGETTYTFMRMVKLFSNLMINNSSFLLNILGRVGITTSFISVLYSIYLAMNTWIFGNPIKGWTTLVVLTLFLGGLILLGLGIIGEYLIRIINTMDARPVYVIRDRIGFEQKRN